MTKNSKKAFVAKRKKKDDLLVLVLSSCTLSLAVKFATILAGVMSISDVE